MVKNLLTQSIREYRSISLLSNKILQPDGSEHYCPIHASLRNQTASTRTGTGVPLVTYVAILSEGLIDVEYQ